MTTRHCNTEYHDRTAPDATHTPIHCRRTHGHAGPHYNPTAGLTWGNPTNWFGDDAA